MQDKLNSKKNILIFFWYYSHPGGAELFVEEVTRRLLSDYNFELITAKCKKNLPREERINGVLIHRLGIGNFFIDKFFFPCFAILKAFKIKKAKRISVIHAVIANVSGFAAMTFHQLTKIPFLITEQSGNLDRQVRKLTPIAFWIYKKIYQKADFIHVISNFLKQTVLVLGVEEEKIEIIPNGINLSEFESFTEGERKEKYRIVSVARLNKYKGLEYLITAMPEILKSFPKAKLVLIGSGNERENLKLRIKNLKIEDKVEFKGDIPHKEIPKELVKSSVFVLPSLEEGQGVVVLEAQASGIPVIGTNVGGIPDFIRDGKTGILVGPAEPRDISQAVIKIFSEPEFAQKLVENAKDDLERYDWDNVADKIDKIYKRLFL